MRGLKLWFWRSFLPTRIPLEDYREAIPERVRAEIDSAAGLFDRVEVWTPKGNTFFDRVLNLPANVGQAWWAVPFVLGHVVAKDPLAVGFAGDGMSPLVQWGDEIPSFAEIIRFVIREKAKWLAAMWLLPALVALSVITGAWFGAINSGLFGLIFAAVGALLADLLLILFIGIGIAAISALMRILRKR
jgi:hypothetical protein